MTWKSKGKYLPNRNDFQEGKITTNDSTLTLEFLRNQFSFPYELNMLGQLESLPRKEGPTGSEESLVVTE
jgi:hypothetical protein